VRKIGAGYTNDAREKDRCEPTIPRAWHNPKGLGCLLESGSTSCCRGFVSALCSATTESHLIWGHCGLLNHLPQSKANPSDARQKLQVTAWMSLWPARMEKYRLGANYGVPHGIASLAVKVAPVENKQWLAGTLHRLLEGDIVKLSGL